MSDKLAFLNRETASAFEDESVVAAYDFRPKLHPATFPFLADLTVGSPKRVLDVGCGTGFVARHLIDHVDEIDAVDSSGPMLRTAKTLPNGNHPNIQWVLGAVEKADLTGRYGLVTAGSSFHWFDWPSVMPKFAHLLADGGVIAIIRPKIQKTAWFDDVMNVVKAHSTIENFSRFDMKEVLTERGYWEPLGEHETAAAAQSQPVREYVQSWHGRASLSIERMGAENARAFDEAVTEIVQLHCGETVTLQVSTQIMWGRPLK